MEEIVIPLVVVPVLFLLLPWMILHYVSKWKSNSSLTEEDEKMLDELYDLARRLDERMHTIERIMADENPHWRALDPVPLAPRLEKAEVHELSARLARERSPIGGQAGEGRL